MKKIVVIIITLQILLAGCMQTIEIGSMPNTDSLDQLTQDVSTKADALKILGPPRGYGMGRLPNMNKPMVGWFYEYSKIYGTQKINTEIVMNMELAMLWLFFDGEIYKGHMWVSSFTKPEVKQ